MAFLAPIVAKAAPALIGLGSSLVGSKINKVRPSAQEQQVLANNAQAQQIGIGQANRLFPQSQNVLNMSTQAYAPVQNYWQSLLSGNRALTTSAMAPEISRIGQGYQQAAKTSAALSPRGGPSASFLAEQPFQQQRDVSTSLQQARPQAAQGLFGIGQALGSHGLGMLQSGVASLYASSAAGRDILANAQQNRQLEAERGRSIGSGIFDFVNKFGLDSLFKGGNKPKLGGGTGYPNYPAGGDYGPGF